MSLLAPQDRVLLLDSLRPPPDYELHTAIGTTYSLDLLALMVAPVGFTLFDHDPTTARFADADPLEVLESIRRHADKIILVCEAGRIAVPLRYRILLANLEKRILQAVAPTEKRAFHPKVWILRYAPTVGGLAVRYRLLCASRNLTFDRSWDTLLALDGEFDDARTNGFSVNAPLREFITELPRMAAVAPRREMVAQIRTIESEIARVAWNTEGLPAELAAFWPMGHAGRRTRPFKGRIDRMAIISPFVSADALEELNVGSPGVLVSRQESLDAVGEDALDGFGDVYTLSGDGAVLEPTDADTGTPSNPGLSGLHAKLYIADAGWDARLWTGSANATSAAFDGNVEFLVELLGKKSVMGIDALFQKQKGIANLADMLTPYESTVVEPGDALHEELLAKAEGLRLPLAAREWVVSVGPEADGGTFGCTVSTRKKLPVWDDEIVVTCRLASMAESAALPLASGKEAALSFTPLSLEALSAFLVLKVQARRGEVAPELEFTVVATMENEPVNRRERLLRSMLVDRASLVRFLLLLLSDVADSTPGTGAGGEEGSRWAGFARSTDGAHALLEPLLRALDRSPDRLDAVRSLVHDLAQTDDARHLLPQGLLELVEAVCQARAEINA